MNLSRRAALAATLSLPVFVAIATQTHAATPPVYSEGGGIAVDGTDVVAYFTQSKSVAGDAAITHVWNNATWQFATEKNRAAFAANPAAYAPQYGGYCAYAVSEGYTAPTDPKAWTIVEGKLYLNFSARVQRRWARDIPGRIEAGDSNWPNVLQ